MRSLALSWLIDLSSNMSVGKEAAKKAMVYFLDLVNNPFFRVILLTTNKNVIKRHKNNQIKGKISQLIDNAFGSVENKNTSRLSHNKITLSCCFFILNKKVMLYLL